jgi:hypothetical protein
MIRYLLLLTMFMKGISSIFYVMDTYGYNYYSIFISEDLTNEWYTYLLAGPMG